MPSTTFDHASAARALPPTRALERFAIPELSTVIYALALATGLTLILLTNFLPVGALRSYKHVPLGLALIASLCDLAIDPQSIGRLVEVLRRHWNLVLFMAIVLSGALYSRFVLGLQDTFLTQGVSYLGFFLAWQIFSPARCARFGATMVKTFTAFALIALCLTPYGFTHNIPVIHEGAYLFVPWLLYLFWRARSLLGRSLVFTALVAIGPLCLKNTVTIIGAVCLVIMYIIENARIWSLGRALMFARTWAFVLLIAAAVAGFYLFAPPIEGFSTGNTEFRRFNIDAKWNQFLQSPVYGNWYVGFPYIRFTLFSMGIGARDSISVTHNDFLDMLAHGGLVGITLVLFTFYKVAASVGAKLRVVGNTPRETGVMAALIGCVVCGIITMSFNPVLGHGINGFMFWTMVGMLAAISRSAAFPQAQPSDRPGFAT
jgi:hypothetical protein